ncbi:MAG: Tetratricopeptide 2 repeat protein [Bacteroidetes bacterium]|nr:Tetratricopeptide 2 repeat protein [Bacteroidota bacterium]
MSRRKHTRVCRVIVLLIVLGTLAVPVHTRAADPGSIDWALVHEITNRGIDRFYRLETDAAIQRFDSVARMAPEDPRGYFFKSIVHFSLYALERDKRHFDAFMKQSDYVISVCEQLLENNEHDAMAKFYLGGIYGYRGMLWQTEGSLVKAVTEGRKGYLYLEEAVEERPDLYDAHMGFGLFRYLVAKAPRSLHWMMKLLGITPDREGGLQMLKTAAEKGIYTRNEARLYLAQFLFSEHRQDEAFAYINQLCTEYPENSLFLMLRASWYQRTGQLDEAMADALKAMERNSRRPIRFVENILHSTLGSIYYSRNDFANSQKHYALYSDSGQNSQSAWSRTWYRIGVAHELNGDRNAAVAAFARARKDNEMWGPMAAYYYRRAQYSLRHPISGAEADIIRAENEMNVKAYDSAFRLYTAAVASSGNDIEIRSRALLGLMQLQYELKRYQDVEETSKQLLALRPAEERWVLPHGYFTLGQAYAQTGRSAEARKAFEMVDEFDDYDYQDRLESRVEDALEKLEKAGE